MSKAEFDSRKTVRVVFSGGAKLQLTAMSEAEVAELSEYLTAGRRYVYRGPFGLDQTVILPDQVAYFEVTNHVPDWH